MINTVYQVYKIERPQGNERKKTLSLVYLQINEFTVYSTGLLYINIYAVKLIRFWLLVIVKNTCEKRTLEVLERMVLTDILV